MHLLVSSKLQKLQVLSNNTAVKSYQIGTATRGMGEQKNSYQTPRGWHQIRAKIGHNCPLNTIFVARRATGEIYQTGMQQQFPDRDWILTRIMWLSGLEVGKNRLGGVDSMQRYIYLHGVPDEIQLGRPSSSGCVNMYNTDIAELFDIVPVGTRIYIEG